MPTVGTSSTTLDAGTSGYVRLTNAGSAQATVRRGTDSSVLWPGCTLVVIPAGVPVTASTVGAGTTTTINVATGSNDTSLPSSGVVSWEDLSADAKAAISSTYVAQVGPTFIDATSPQYGSGIDTTGGSDSSTHVLAALADAAAKNCTLVLPRGVIRVDSQMVPGGSSDYTVSGSLRITGAGADTPWSSADGNGTTLDLRYSGTGAKIFLNKQKNVEIDHMNIVDNGLSSTPFILSTNSILHAHNLRFRGNKTKSGTTCDQDAIILGGTTQTVDAGITAPFQGYGTVIEKCGFGRIRRAAYLRAWCNSVNVRDNQVNGDCGSPDAQGAPYEVDGQWGFARDNKFEDSILQVQNYKYGVAINGASARNFVSGIDCWDANGYWTGVVYFSSTSIDNTAILAGEEILFTDVSGDNMVICRDGSFNGRQLTIKVAKAGRAALLAEVNTGGNGVAWLRNQFRGGFVVGDASNPEAVYVTDGAWARKWGVMPTGAPKWISSATCTTGSGSAALGANSPATTNTAPYKWLTVLTDDGSTCYIPAWK